MSSFSPIPVSLTRIPFYLNRAASIPVSIATANVNLFTLLNRSAEGAEYLQTLEQALEGISQFRPEYLVVSLGCDGMHDDPVGTLHTTRERMRETTNPD